MLRFDDITTCDCCKHTFEVSEGLYAETHHSFQSMMFDRATSITFAMCDKCLLSTPKPVLSALIDAHLGTWAKMPGTRILILGEEVVT